MKALIILVLVMKVSFANPMDEVLLNNCQLTGNTLFLTCIATPPITPDQISSCTTLFSQYMACSIALNSPEPMLIAKDLDPYTWSPFDPCRFEVQHLILWEICPSAPVD